ncbi:MAG: hypothetical protein J2O49_03930 [Sciscionella sp.]|nr:hypothetical protein [Sciscionella sp.]
MTEIRLDHLVTLGLSEIDASVYLRLLALGAATPDQLAAFDDTPVGKVKESFAELLNVGLVTEADADTGSVLPTPPNAGLDLLTRRRLTELDEARVAMMAAFDSFRRSVSPTPAEQLIEVIPHDAVHGRIMQLERGAQTCIRGLDSPPYYANVAANTVELNNLERGVRYQAVYAKAALEDKDYLAHNITPSVRAGEEARTLPEVPVKLMLVDDAYAVVSITDGNADGSALLIRPCSLLSALFGLFEMCWRAGLPLSVREDGDGPFLQPIQRRLLALLAAGLGDEQVARGLGISRRTLFRYLEGLLATTGAANRFQLALYAVRNKWI